jgi:hypothetical protein
MPAKQPMVYIQKLSYDNTEITETLQRNKWLSQGTPTDSIHGHETL